MYDTITIGIYYAANSECFDGCIKAYNTAYQAKIQLGGNVSIVNYINADSGDMYEQYLSDGGLPGGIFPYTVVLDGNTVIHSSYNASATISELVDAVVSNSQPNTDIWIDNDIPAQPDNDIPAQPDNDDPAKPENGFYTRYIIIGIFAVLAIFGVSYLYLNRKTN